jgi:hypothetical protein
MRWLQVILAALIAATALAGCGRTGLRDLADAREGARAYQLETDPVRRAMIAEGALGYLLAGLNGYPLPAPSRTAALIRAQPAAYAKGGRAAEADPLPYVAPPAAGAPPAGVLARFTYWGGFLLDVGLLIGALGGIILVLLKAGRWIGWIPTLPASLFWRLIDALAAPLARLAALWGGASVALGAALTWLAAWWWAVALVALAVGAFLVWDHWRAIRRWLKARGVR